jgi:hypothetical protein
MSRQYFRLSLTREFNYVRQSPVKVHGVAFDAHIAEMSSNAVGAFLATTHLPYFIDPVLYKFSQPYFEGFVGKRWVEPLSKAYGIDDQVTGTSEGFTPSELSKFKGIDAAVASMLDYQRSRFTNLSPKMEALVELLEEEPSSIAPPEFLVAPYLITSDGASLSANQRLLSAAIKAKQQGERLYAVAAVDVDYIEGDALRQSVVSQCAKPGVDGVLAWVTDFNESLEDSVQLNRLASFFAELKAALGGKEVINLYSGFYSTILAGRKFLAATVQGVGISEYKDPGATGGGGVLRYYVPLAHQHVGVDLAEDLRQADPKLFSCSCSHCSSGGPINDLSVEALAKHYLRTRVSELGYASKTQASAIEAGLRSDARLVDAVKGGVAATTGSFERRLRTWADAVSADTKVSRYG